MIQVTQEHFKRAAFEVSKHGDNDTLPFDLDVRLCGDVAEELSSIAFGFFNELKSGPLKGNHERIASMSIWSERLVAPSGPAGFRVVTKIHPFWNIYLNGISLAIAEQLEQQRAPTAHSYRFLPGSDQFIFDANRSWRAFKEETIARSEDFGPDAVVVQTDISSFYEHVSHHYVENCISDLDNGQRQIASQVNALLSRLFAGRSFGLPVGGQGARVLAELFLHQVDMSLSAQGIHWHRYVDDYVIIASNTSEAYRALAVLAQSLMDYGLTLNKSKSVFLSQKHYKDYVIAQLGNNDDEAQQLRTIDIKFDPYSDSPRDDYESLKETVESLEVQKLLARELDKAIPDSFLVSQISRTLPLHKPDAAFELAVTLLSKQNLHAFRSSFSTIMRGFSHLRSKGEFSAIFPKLDSLLDEVPIHSGHLLEADTNLLHYLRCLRFSSSMRRSQFVRATFDGTQLDTVKRACIDCWRGWKDRSTFNYLRNRWSQMTAESQRSFWLFSYCFGDEGEKARLQSKRAAASNWELGVELNLDPVSDKAKLAKHTRGTEPRFPAVFMEWSKEACDAG
ncbi:TPA: RNA-directed DNA polymerase [Stenotrophomonas maltophilia]|nr:RNA-directed DNA polymerase [Stenotrophomonas maltophilia]HDS1582374.1 RNA-directed DNA polymerase [Stenotrophomonas maltophilia]